MDIKKFVNALAGTFSAGVTVRLINFFLTVILVHHLSAADYGSLTLLMTFSLTIAYLSAGGMPQAITFFLAKKDEADYKIISISLLLFVCIGTLTVWLGYIFKNIVVYKFLKDVQSLYYYLLLCYFFTFIINIWALSVYRGFQNFLLYNIFIIFNPIGNFIGISILCLLSKITIGSIMTVYIIVSLSTTLWLLIKLSYGNFIRFYLNWNLTKSICSYGLKSYLQLITGHLMYQIDVYIIYYLTGADQVAFYSIAVAVATLLWFIPDTIGIVLFPTLSSTKNESEIHSISAKVCRNSLFCVAIGAFSLALLGSYLIEFFYGSPYYRSVKPMLLILPGIVAMSGYKILTRDFSSRNRQQIPIIVAFLSLVINIILNFIWIPKFGIEGASLASTVAYFFAVSVLILFFKSESKILLKDILIIRKDDLKFFVGLFNSIFINRFKT